MISKNGPYIAHRGASRLAPENTQAAFRAALATGVSSIELDIGLTSDGEFRVLHDDTLERTTNGSGRLDQSPACQVDALDAGSWFSSSFAGEKVPRLTDVLDWAKDRVHLNLEIKTAAAKEGTALRLLSILKERDMIAQTSIISFDSPIIEEIERLAPEVDTGVLLSERPTLRRLAMGTLIGLGSGIVAGLALGVAGIACIGVGLGASLMGGGLAKVASGLINARNLKKSQSDAVLPFWIDAEPRLISEAKKLGKRVVPYTANNPLLVRGLLRMGVSAVITDTPEIFGPTTENRAKYGGI